MGLELPQACESVSEVRVDEGAVLAGGIDESGESALSGSECVDSEHEVAGPSVDGRSAGCVGAGG